MPVNEESENEGGRVVYTLAWYTQYAHLPPTPWPGMTTSSRMVSRHLYQAYATASSFRPDCLRLRRVVVFEINFSD